MATNRASWHEVALRIADERSYWLATVAPDGSPHISPVWGVVVEDVWYSYSERRTVKARNLITNPLVAMHLDGGEDVCIVHGRLVDIGLPADHPAILTTFGAKYTRPGDLEFLPGSDPAFDVMFALRPSRAKLWQLLDYRGSQRRWRSDGDPA